MAQVFGVPLRREKRFKFIIVYVQYVLNLNANDNNLLAFFELCVFAPPRFRVRKLKIRGDPEIIRTAETLRRREKIKIHYRFRSICLNANDNNVLAFFELCVGACPAKAKKNVGGRLRGSIYLHCKNDS